MSPVRAALRASPRADAPRMLSALVLVAAVAFAAVVAPAAHADDVADVAAARAEAARPYSSAAAAVAAYKRLERLREPLLSQTDPRVAIWLADAAEDALTLGLAADSTGLATLAGLPTPAMRDHTAALLRQSLEWTQRADQAARAELAQGTAPQELLDRLDATERMARIPLLRSVAAVWAARVGALPADDATQVLASAVARLDSLRTSLKGPARNLAALAYGMGLVLQGRHDQAVPVLAEVLARPEADEGARVLATVFQAEAASGAAVERRRALAALRDRSGAALSDQSRLLLGDADFRFAQDAAAQGGAGDPPWSGWLDAASKAPPATRTQVLLAALERVAAHCPPSQGAVPQLAAALLELRSSQQRAAAAERLAALQADPALPPPLSALAQLELGRALLTMGQAREGAVLLLAYAQQHAADPASPHAMEAAVTAARALGDAPFLAAVLDAAVRLFPDHPDHGAWRVELAALALSPDGAQLAQREPAARRYARALEALDRADRAPRTDAALRADLALAAAEAANELGHPDDAVAVLVRVGGASNSAPDIPEALRARMLEERVAAVGLTQRSVAADPWVSTAARADASATADAVARVLLRQMPMDLGESLVQPPPAEVRSRLARLAQAVQVLAPAAPERDQVVARALLIAGLPDAAQSVAERVLEANPDRADALLALAECLYGTADTASQARAMELFTRVGRAAPEGTATWWLCELRRLQILDRVNRNVEVIAPRVARLKAAHADLGGPALEASFLELAARHE
ncbi:MAG: hypothetical protein U0636_08090 [Phycisphaerales bacterium]